MMANSFTTKVWDTRWVTLFGGAGSTDWRYVTPQADYLDAGQYTTLTVRLSMPGVTNVGLKLEHASSLDGVFRNVYEDQETLFEGTTTALLVLSSEGGDRVFTRYLRWVIDGGSATHQWRACFRIEAFV